MTNTAMYLPVFLPGNNRDFKEIQGIATISDEGEINIKLQRKEAAMELAKMKQDGILFALAFDYLDPAQEQKK